MIKHGLLVAALFCILLGLSACRTAEKTDQSYISTSASLFVPVSESSGFKFMHDPGVDGTYFMPESIGSGAAFLDYDNDSDLDLLLLNSGPHGKGQSKARSPNKLFRQDPGMHFSDVTEIAGLTGTGYSMGVAIGDIDNDGDVDVYITNFGSDELYRNNGDGTFTNITADAGIKNPAWGTSVTFLDYDRDGLLDIYVANYVLFDPSIQCTDRAGRADYCGPDGYHGSPDVLYHNDGNNKFTDVSIKSGITAIAGKGLGVVATDFNGDHYIDIFVANDGEPNFLWINQLNGTFKNETLTLGAALNALGQPEANMGIAIGDADSDMDLDLYLTHLRGETNTFFRNVGKFGFQDDSAISHLGGTKKLTGFGTGFFDYDHDGDLDVFVANGRVTRGPLITKNSNYWDYYAEPNLLYENKDQKQFTDVSNRCGSLCSSVKNSRGAAFGDVDNDGDIDLLVTNEGGHAELYINEAPKTGHWLEVRAIDPKLKRDELDARITITGGGKKVLRVVNPYYSYLSSNDFRVHFGITSNKVDSIQIVWPDGTSETFDGTTVDRFLTLEKGKGRK